MAKRKRAHGGRRPGAGRPAGEVKRTISPRVTPATYLKLGDNPTKKAGEIVEDWARK